MAEDALAKFTFFVPGKKDATAGVRTIAGSRLAGPLDG